MTRFMQNQEDSMQLYSKLSAWERGLFASADTVHLGSVTGIEMQDGESENSLLLHYLWARNFI
jgi:hypothetical protein